MITVKLLALKQAPGHSLKKCIDSYETDGCYKGVPLEQNSPAPGAGLFGGSSTFEGYLDKQLVFTSSRLSTAVKWRLHCTTSSVCTIYRNSWKRAPSSVPTLWAFLSHSCHLYRLCSTVCPPNWAQLKIQMWRCWLRSLDLCLYCSANFIILLLQPILVHNNCSTLLLPLQTRPVMQMQE